MPNFAMQEVVIAMVISAVCAYLLGSINFAIVISKVFYKKDIRSLGSGNAGMSNMARSFGKTSAAVTLLGDALKGVAAVFLARFIMIMFVTGATDFFAHTAYTAYAAAIFAIVGHMFPIFFKFKGGKGIATSLGVILSLLPLVALGLLVIFLIIFVTTKMVSLGSIIGISLYPVCTWLWCTFVSQEGAAFSTVCALIIAGLVVLMHRENIARLRSGKEYKFEAKDDTQNQ